VHGEYRQRTVDEPFRLLVVGQVRPWKGLDIIVKALALIKSKFAFQLSVVGRIFPESSFHKKLIQQITKHGLQDRITLHGHRSPEELAAFYQNSDIYILSSRYETYGIVLLEAMSFGLPIISSRIPSALEIVREGKNALFYAVEDPGGLAECLKTVLTNPSLYRALSNNNYAYTKQERTWKTVAEETLRAIMDYL
jgi:glycosyltransferase involved in cell wall biosynthesis